jgi:hypothetical protein
LVHSEKRFQEIVIQKEGGLLKFAVDGKKPESLVNAGQLINASETNEAEGRAAKKIMMHRGENLPEEWMQTILQTDIHYVRIARESSNIGEEQKLAAAELAERPLSRDKTKILNGLPDVPWATAFIELSRMGLDSGEANRWRKVKSETARRLGHIGISDERITKKGVLDELGKGNSDVLLLIAHSDGKHLYLPGLWGEKLSIDEIESIRREEAPNRLIILLVCNAGAGNTRSFANAIIGSKLAKTVIASERRVRAERIPQFLTALFDSQPAWKAFQKEGLHQIVKRSTKSGIYG